MCYNGITKRRNVNMEKKLKTIEYELERTEKRLEDLLAGIKQLRKEVHDILPKEIKKIIHERVVLDRNETRCYINLNDYFRLTPNISIENYVRYIHHKTSCKYFLDNPTRIILTNWTEKREIILTYIPSKNLVIIVER